MKQPQKSKSSAKKTNNGDARIELPAVLDIAFAEAFFAQLNDALLENANAILMGEKVERLTTPCAQLLLAAAKTIQEKGGKSTLEKPSNVIKDVFADLGFMSEFQQWSNQT